MLSPESVLHRRFAHERAGLDLVAIEDAALPVTLANVDVLVQERKPLPLLHEFVLRLAYAGVRNRAETARLLGIDESLVSAAIVDQVSADNLHYSAATADVRLTERGLEAVRTHESIKPAHASFVLPFDRMTWSVADYRRPELITKQEARDANRILLPASRTSRIALADLPAPAINGWLRRREGSNVRRQVLQVQRVSPHSHLYLPVRLLVYVEATRNEVEVAVVVDGDLSLVHDTALQASGGVGGLGITVDPTDSRPRLSTELEERRASAEEVAELRAAAVEGRITAAELEASSFSDPQPTSNEEEALDRIEVRSVSVFEHRDLLQEALDTARQRLLIISPWVRSGVVDRSFAARLENRLKQDVAVTIAYGIGRDDRQSDSAAIGLLATLRDQYENFDFIRLENTHAKVLIFDDRWISTSFNWLSFKGDPSRTYRMEEGTLVKIPGQVTAQYESYLSLILAQRRADL